jgi:hypothetical protein
MADDNNTTKKPDELGQFLRQYGEYLDGKRSYSDLPIPTAAELKAAAEQNLRSKK